MIMGKKKIVEKRREYINELFGEEKLELMSSMNNCDGPAILEEEVLDAIVMSYSFFS